MPAPQVAELTFYYTRMRLSQVCLACPKLSMPTQLSAPQMTDRIAIVRISPNLCRLVRSIRGSSISLKRSDSFPFRFSFIVWDSSGLSWSSQINTWNARTSSQQILRCVCPDPLSLSFDDFRVSIVWDLRIDRHRVMWVAGLKRVPSDFLRWIVESPG